MPIDKRYEVKDVLAQSAADYNVGLATGIAAWVLEYVAKPRFPGRYVQEGGREWIAV